MNQFSSHIEKKIVLLENKQVTVWAYPDLKLIHHVMNGFSHGDSFREALTKGVEGMEKYQATRWLSDDRLNSALPEADEKWAIANWFPRTKAAGWKHWAIVQPKKVVGQMNMDRFRKMYADLGINARMFSDPDEAFVWILAQ